MITSHRRKGLLALLLAVVLVAAACGGSDSGSDTSSTEARTASDVGVTADTIKIGVGVSDLDGLRASGFSLPATLTTDTLAKRVESWVAKWNAAGGINGRQIEVVRTTWDPVKPATQDAMCAKATVDEGLFAIIVPTGLNTQTIQCLVDGGLLTFFGEFAGQAAFDTELLVTIPPPVESTGGAGAQALIDAGVLPKGDTIGILGANSPALKAAGDEAKSVFEAAGYTTQVVEVNLLQGDTGAINQESGAAVGTFKANGVKSVVAMIPFPYTAGFFEAAGTDFSINVVDVASANCTPFGASRTPANAIGATCVTIWDNTNTAAGAVRPDTAFEAECRANFAETFSALYPTPPAPGVPSGQIIDAPDGTKLSSDYDAAACTITRIFGDALTAAGNNPTRANVYQAALGLGSVQIAGASNGQGTLATGKPFAADFVHQVKLTAVPAGTAKSANGTYNGCPAPVTCWVPVTDNWTAIPQ